MKLKTTRDTAMAFAHWCDGLCFARSPVRCNLSSVPRRLWWFAVSIGSLQMAGIFGEWEVWTVDMYG